jgi:hypothetical protein
VNTRRNAVAAAGKVDARADSRVDAQVVAHAAAGRAHTPDRLNKVNIVVHTMVHRDIVMTHARNNPQHRARRPIHRHVMIVLLKAATRNINVGVHHVAMVSNKATHPHRTANKKGATMANMADVMMVAAANLARRNNINRA